MKETTLGTEIYNLYRNPETRSKAEIKAWRSQSL